MVAVGRRFPNIAPDEPVCAALALLRDVSKVSLSRVAGQEAAQEVLLRAARALTHTLNTLYDEVPAHSTAKSGKVLRPIATAQLSALAESMQIGELRLLFDDPETGTITAWTSLRLGSPCNAKAGTSNCHPTLLTATDAAMKEVGAGCQQNGPKKVVSLLCRRQYSAACLYHLDLVKSTGVHAGALPELRETATDELIPADALFGMECDEDGDEDGEGVGAVESFLQLCTSGLSKRCRSHLDFLYPDPDHAAGVGLAAAAPAPPDADPSSSPGADTPAPPGSDTPMPPVPPSPVGGASVPVVAVPVASETDDGKVLNVWPHRVPDSRPSRIAAQPTALLDRRRSCASHQLASGVVVCGTRSAQRQ